MAVSGAVRAVLARPWLGRNLGLGTAVFRVRVRKMCSFR